MWTETAVGGIKPLSHGRDYETSSNCCITTVELVLSQNCPPRATDQFAFWGEKREKYSNYRIKFGKQLSYHMLICEENPGIRRGAVSAGLIRSCEGFSSHQTILETFITNEHISHHSTSADLSSQRCCTACAARSDLTLWSAFCFDEFNKKKKTS